MHASGPITVGCLQVQLFGLLHRQFSDLGFVCPGPHSPSIQLFVATIFDSTMGVFNVHNVAGSWWRAGSTWAWCCLKSPDFLSPAHFCLITIVLISKQVSYLFAVISFVENWKDIFFRNVGPVNEMKWHNDMSLPIFLSYIRIAYRFDSQGDERKGKGGFLSAGTKDLRHSFCSCSVALRWGFFFSSLPFLLRIIPSYRAV